MKFCTISPIKGLQQYGTYLSNRHLVLANWLHNEEYCRYYTRRRLAGDFLILDNGAYENTRPLDSAAYFNWIKNLDPAVVVLPDILKSPWRKTTSAALQFLDLYTDLPQLAKYRTEWMFVPQTTTDQPDGVFKALEKVLDDPRQGYKVNWVGLSRYLCKLNTYSGYSPGWTFRCELAQWIRKNFPHVKFHALGMNAGRTNELEHLKDLGVESIDSSCAVWRGWGAGSGRGVSLTDPSWETSGTPCDFGTVSEPDHEQIINNLEAIRNALRG
jgi:hypothetical protein